MSIFNNLRVECDGSVIVIQVTDTHAITEARLSLDEVDDFIGAILQAKTEAQGLVETNKRVEVFKQLPSEQQIELLSRLGGG